MFSGMTIFLIICTVFPNGLNLRPEVFTRDNFCIELVKRIYQTDTPTNVLPSLHSVVDVVAACVMAYFMYSLIYAQEGAKSPRLARQVI